MEIACRCSLNTQTENGAGHDSPFLIQKLHNLQIQEYWLAAIIVGSEGRILARFFKFRIYSSVLTFVFDILIIPVY